MNKQQILKVLVPLMAMVFKFNAPADALLSKFFRENKKLGAKDRDIIAETVYMILRNYYKLHQASGNNLANMIKITWVELMKIPVENEYRSKAAYKLDYDIIELPEWLITKLSTQYSEAEIKQISTMMEAKAPLTLRANTYLATRDEVMKEFREHKIEVVPTKFSPYGITLNNKHVLNKNPLFLEGKIEVQDEASQLAGMLLAPRRKEMVVDFCAGSGGKTLLLGAMMQNTGRVYAFDISEKRLNNLPERLKRSGLSNIYPQLIKNETDDKVKKLYGKIDRVFVDAPCSGLGTLRRNPDLKFRQTANAIDELNQIQLSILNSASKLLKEKGYIVYATCSILRSENQDIVQQFLKQNHNFTIIPVTDVIKTNLFLKDQSYLELRPDTHNSDGFFACLLQKISSEDVDL